jgi:hypothetical protein
MIRMTNPQARALLTRLLALRRAAPQADWDNPNAGEEAQELCNLGTFSPDLYNACVCPDAGYVRSPEETLDQTIDNLVAQLKEEADIPALLDHIGYVLTANYPRNVMSGTNLEDLAQALFDPEKLRKIRQEWMAKRSCAGCGHEFAANGDAEITMMKTSGREYSLYCATCATPQVMSCGTCRKAMPIPSNVRNALKKAQAEKCPSCVAAADGLRSGGGGAILSEPDVIGPESTHNAAGRPGRIFAASDNWYALNELIGRAPAQAPTYASYLTATESDEDGPF